MANQLTPRLTPSVSKSNSTLPSPIRVPSPEPGGAMDDFEGPATARAVAGPSRLFEGEVEDEAFAARTEQLSLEGTTPQETYVMPLASDEKVFDRTLSTDAGISSHINDSSGSSSLGRVVVISGGSGYNDLVGATPEATFVMPISDNGGSSSEIIRVLGGPSIGDLRSRLVRLIPVTTATAQYRHGSDLSSRPLPSSNDAIHRLLAYRLPSTGSSRDIKQEWMDILEGRHKLWRGIEPERKECIRGFLVHFEADILRRAHRNFNFRGGSIGNFFLAAAQKFFRSIQSAIFLFSVTTQSHSPLLGGARVLPVINTNHTATIAAELANGETIVGQCEISHPAVATKTSASSGRTSASHTGPATPAESVIFDPIQRIRHQQQQQRPSGSSRLTVGAFGDGLEPSGDEDEQSDDEEGEGEIDDDRSEAAGTDDDDDDDVVDYVQRVSRRHGKRRPRRRSENESRQLRNIVFSKTDGGSDEDGTPPLSAPIERVFYVNAYRNEVHPAPNPAFLSCLSNDATTLVYSCGSLWTSLVPCLALRGVARAIKSSPSLRYKVLLLNTTHDRETAGLDAVDFIDVIYRALLLYPRHRDQGYEPRDFVTHVVYFKNGSVKVDESKLQSMGIQCICATSTQSASRPRFDEESVKRALSEIVTSS